MQNGIFHVADSAFIDNYSGEGIGALAYIVTNSAQSGQTVIENTLFQGNSAKYQGSALVLIDATGRSNVSALIQDSDFIGNKTPFGRDGLSMTATVVLSRFVNNEAASGAALLSSNLSGNFDKDC